MKQPSLYSKQGSPQDPDQPFASLLSASSSNLSENVENNRQNTKYLKLPLPTTQSNTKSLINTPERIKTNFPNYTSTVSATTSLNGAKSAYERKAVIKGDEKDSMKTIVRKIHATHPASEVINLGLVESLVKFESSYRPSAVSSDGHFSKGLFQLLDGTALDRLKDRGLPAESYDPFDPTTNTMLGLDHLNYLSNNLRGSVPKEDLNHFILASYNSGLGRVKRAIKVAEANANLVNPNVSYKDIEPLLPKSTAKYVQNIISDWRQFEIQR